MPLTCANTVAVASRRRPRLTVFSRTLAGLLGMARTFADRQLALQSDSRRRHVHAAVVPRSIALIRPGCLRQVGALTAPTLARLSTVSATLRLAPAWPGPFGKGNRTTGEAV